MLQQKLGSFLGVHSLLNKILSMMVSHVVDQQPHGRKESIRERENAKAPTEAYIGAGPLQRQKKRIRKMLRLKRAVRPSRLCTRRLEFWEGFFFSLKR